MPNTATLLQNINHADLRVWLQSHLSEERLHYSLNTQQKATELARNFKFSALEIEKVGIAGMLCHAAEKLEGAALLKTCEELDLFVTAEDRQFPNTLRAFVAAQQVWIMFNIGDEDILNAIRFHPTGRPGMSNSEKIVFLAENMTENTRNPLYTQKIISLLDFRDKTTLDRAVLYVLDTTMTYQIEKEQIIHSRTFAARNDLLGKLTPRYPVYRTHPS